MTFRLRSFNVLLAMLVAVGCVFVLPDMAQSELRCADNGSISSGPDLREGEVCEPDGCLSLEEALSLVLMKNPGLKAFSWEMRASEAMILQAGVLPNPEVEVDVEEFDSAGTGFDTAETAIVLSQLVELGGKRGKRRLVAKLESGLAGWGYEAMRQDVLAETTQAFVDVLADQKLLTLAEESVALAEKVYAAAGERVKAGKVTPLEESRAGVELSIARMGLARSRKELHASRAVLAAMWGVANPTFAEVIGEYELVPNCLPPITSFAEDVAMNPDLARWATEMELREAAIALERSALIPDLSARAGVQQYEATGEDALTFGIAVTLPLFDRNRGGIQAARYQMEKADEEKRSIELKIQRELVDAYNELTVSHQEAVTFQQDILPSAERAFEAARNGYQQGKFGYLDMLDAQRTMLDVRTRYIESLSSYHKTVAVLDRLAGRPVKIGSKQ